MRRTMHRTLWAIAFLLTSHGDGTAASLEPSQASSPRPAASVAAASAPSAESVVLVTIDGVRWQEIFEGASPDLADAAALPRGEARSPREITPHLHRLFFDEGVVIGDPHRGEGFFASGPTYVSLPGYVEMMTGAVSGCRDNDCEPRMSWTLPREAAKPGSSSEGAAVFSSWERVARAVPHGVHSILLRAGRDPEEQAPPFPGHGAYRPDRSTAALAIAHLVAVRPRFLWVALGDTDEWAHRNDYRGYIEALHFADAFVGELAAHLDQMGDRGARTALFVTADHGRDRGFANHGGPDSARVWLMARGSGIARKGLITLDRPHHLRDVAPTIAALIGLPHRACETCGEVMDELF